MASKPSKTTPTSTIVRPDQISSTPNIPTAQQNLKAKPTKPIPITKPAHTYVAQASVTDAVKLTSTSPTSRMMFFDEVARKCFEVASQEEQEVKETVPEPRKRPTTLPVKPQNALQTDDNQEDTPQTSDTISKSTYTVTVSFKPGEVTTTTTSAKTAGSSTPHPEGKIYNTSGKTMRSRVEQDLLNQAITLFAPIGMAEHLTKIQLILCNEIKTEIQEVKNIITAFPFEGMQRNFSEIATLLDERMTNLEEQYNELNKVVKQGSIQNYIANPALLEHWNPGDMVIKHNLWTTMRLVLNKIASENITDLFPSNWQPW